MLKKHIISSGVCAPLAVTPAVYEFECENENYPEFESLFKWGWIDMDELRSAVSFALLPYCTVGVVGVDLEKVFQYNSFFPPTNKEGPFFRWIIRRVNGEVCVCEGDLAFCPLPNSPAGIVLRDSLGYGDKLFVAAGWGKRVLEFAKKGILGINLVPNSEPSQFWLCKASDPTARMHCTREALNELAPPAPAAVAA